MLDLMTWKVVLHISVAFTNRRGHGVAGGGTDKLITSSAYRCCKGLLRHPDELQRKGGLYAVLEHLPFTSHSLMEDVMQQQSELAPMSWNRSICSAELTQAVVCHADGNNSPSCHIRQRLISAMADKVEASGPVLYAPQHSHGQRKLSLCNRMP